MWNATLRFSVSLLVTSIYRALSFFSFNFAPSSFDVVNSTLCSWVNFPILDLTPATMRPRQRRVHGTHYLNIVPSSISLEVANLEVSRGRTCLRQFNGINSSSLLFYKINRDHQKVVWRRHFCLILVQRCESALSTVLLCFLWRTIASSNCIVWPYSSTWACMFLSMTLSDYSLISPSGNSTS